MGALSNSMCIRIANLKPAGTVKDIGGNPVFDIIFTTLPGPARKELCLHAPMLQPLSPPSGQLPSTHSWAAGAEAH